MTLPTAAPVQMQGNNKLRVGLKSKNKHVLREAVQLYTQGLEVKCQDSSLNAVILCNRAHVESLLGAWRGTEARGVARGGRRSGARRVP